MTGLRIDFANCLSDRVSEHGLRPEALDGAGARLRELTEQLNRTKGAGWERWRSLPFDPARLEPLVRLARFQQRERLVDARRDLPLREQVKQLQQILEEGLGFFRYIMVIP